MKSVLDFSSILVGSKQPRELRYEVVNISKIKTSSIKEDAIRIRR